VNRVDPRGREDCSPGIDFCVTGVAYDPGGGVGGGAGSGGNGPRLTPEQGPPTDPGPSVAGESSGPVSITNWTNQGKQAQIVQNDLNWIGAQISQFPTCDSWLSANSPLGGISDAILTMLGQNPSSGVTQDLVGVGNIGSPSSNNVINAVAGTDGTSLPPTALVAITVNLGGAFFNSSVPTGVTGITGGTQQAQLLILLHELAHLTNAAGFIPGDSSTVAQGVNNTLLMLDCGTFINSVPNTTP
jgi:hypothetical protein